MPLVTDKKIIQNGVISPSLDAVVPDGVNSTLITDPKFKSTVNDTKWIPRNSLLTHIEGASWSVDYFSQIITTDSNLSGQQQSTSAVFQSYKQIKGLELKVSSPLSTDQEDQTKVMRVTGSAILYPFMIPNEGDMFVADIGEGKQAVFRITSSLKKSIFKEACYEISYGLDTDASEKINDLLDRSVETVYYHKDFLAYGQNPLLMKAEADALVSLEVQYGIVLKQYFKMFFSNEFKTFMVPGQEYPTYDHFLVSYMLSQFNMDDCNEMLHVRKLNVDDDDSMQADSFWNAIKAKDISLMNICFNQSGLVDSSTFTKDPVLQGIRYSGFKWIVYPADPTLSVDYLYKNNTKVLSLNTLVPSPIAPNNSTVMVRAINLRDLTTDVGSLIYPVTKDAYYVLSEDFYKKTITQSTLEGITWDYLENKQIDITQLLDVSKQYYQWGLLEKFYYLPLLLTFIRSAIRGF